MCRLLYIVFLQHILQICRGCNVLHVPIQIKPLGVVSPPWRIKIAMACLWIIIPKESQIVGNNPLT